MNKPFVQVKPTIFARPVDQLVDGRQQAIHSQLCMTAPLGCGQPATTFKDEVSRREYQISGLCQTCQDRFFG